MYIYANVYLVITVEYEKNKEGHPPTYPLPKNVKYSLREEGSSKNSVLSYMESAGRFMISRQNERIQLL